MPAATDPRVGTRVVAGQIGVHPVTLWKLCKRGRFPAPFYILGKKTWRQSEVDAWVAAQPQRPIQSGVVRRAAARSRAKR